MPRRGTGTWRCSFSPRCSRWRGIPNAPAEVRGLGGVLARVLVGDRSPKLDALPPELASAVRGMLARLRDAAAQG